MNVILYYISNSSKGTTLKSLLNAKSITYTSIKDPDLSKYPKVKELPTLQVNNNYMNYLQASNYLRRVV